MGRRLLLDMLTGGDDLALFSMESLLARRGLGRAGEGRSRGELVSVGDLRLASK
jgi:hypothetical protein